MVMDSFNPPAMARTPQPGIPRLQRHQFQFSGNAREYFGIWVVNLFLSIITLGIYTAWAKVRRLRYFYANTWLAGHNFEYHAKPLSILIGRIIVVAALLAYNIAISISPLAAVLIVPYLIAIPWIINKALKFRARVTSHRNIRFDFDGTYWRAFWVFAIMPLLAAITLGVLAPVASRLSANYIGNNLKYGTARFSTDAPLGNLYSNWFFSILFLIAVTFVLGIGGAGLVFLLEDTNIFAGVMGNLDNDRMSPGLAAATITGVVAFYIAAILTYLFYAAGVRNVVYGATVLEGGHRFNSTIGRWRYVWILISNLFATIFTLGLLRPWAAIRTWRYMISHTEFAAASDLDDFVTRKNTEGSAAGAEFLDIEGIDFGI